MIASRLRRTLFAGALSTAALSQAVVITAAGVAFLAGCTDTVYQDRQPFNPPVDAAAGFLGYYNEQTKLTACGNCHVGTQSQWLGTNNGQPTAHSQAWAGLQLAGPAVNATCWGCHAISERGNYTTGAVGVDYPASPGSPTYFDVQCESCHGPGYDHVQAPDNRANWPLPHAHLNVLQASCASCHSGSHEPYYDQWKESRHANFNAGEPPGSGPAYEANCVGCHEGNQSMIHLGALPSNWIERDSVGAAAVSAAQYPAADCATCHDPHDATNEGQLRKPVTSPDITQNLCATCHARPASPSASFTNGGRGPHAPQGWVYFGFGAGYIPPGFSFDSLNPASVSHATVARNPTLCAGCHVARFTVTDPNTGSFQFQSVGHLFRPVPCLDANGVPVAANDCPYTTTARNWSGCGSGSGCHDPATAATLLTTERNSVKLLVDQIFENKNGNYSANEAAIVDPAPTDGGLLAIIMQQAPGQFASGAPLTPAEGALYNVYMLSEALYSHNDGSKGVHNPAYYEGLLSANIAQLRAAYPFLPAPRPEVQAIMDRALSRPGVHYSPSLGQVSSR